MGAREGGGIKEKRDRNGSITTLMFHLYFYIRRLCRSNIENPIRIISLMKIDLKHHSQSYLHA